MTSNHNRVDKNMYNAIKGIAITLMIIHHCFGFTKWYIPDINYEYYTVLGFPINDLIASSTKICVSIYAFLSGWVYYYNKNKDLKYSMRKIIKIYKVYWVHLFLIFYHYVHY